MKHTLTFPTALLLVPLATLCAPDASRASQSPVLFTMTCATLMTRHCQKNCGAIAIHVRENRGSIPSHP